MNGIFEFLSPPVKKRRMAQILLCAGCALLGVGGAIAIILLCPFLLEFAYVFAFFWLFGAILLFLCLRAYTEIEYEYQLVAGEWTVERIIGRRRRRTILVTPTNDVTAILPCTKESLADLDYLCAADSARTADLYLVTVEKAGEEPTLVLIHLSTEAHRRFCSYFLRARKR